MKKAIGYRFLFVLTFALLISGFISYIVAGNQLLQGSIKHMTQIVHTIDYSMDYSGDLQEQVLAFQDKALKDSDRITILKLDGSVCADTDTTELSKMENHADREEFKEALKSGLGYANRRSHTLSKDMLYVACKSDYGDYIIRLSINFEGITDYIKVLVPMMLLGFTVVFITSIIIAFQFAGNITKPLNEIAEEMLQMQGEIPQYHFKKYQFEELNIISNTMDKLTDSVKKYIEKLEFEKRIRQEFFSNASHELKTPITSIRGYSEILQNGLAKDKEAQDDCIKRIIKETDNMTNLINDILMISKLETHDANVDFSEVRLFPLLQEVVDSLKPLADSYQVSLFMECQPITMYSSAQQLRELLNNLISNAIKYNVQGGKVWIQIQKEGDEIRIQIKDTGIGISETDKERIFERFYRVDKGRSKRQGGTGLGLSIVKHIVAYYDGEIDLQTKPGEGSTFIIKMPITEESERKLEI